ncbi:MAG: Fe-S protein assembly co-chaperone HscB [Gammaproteobacteria bacterium]|nr:Fe-S protein assembly co-chaperone HscB [Gammaproteobacteria bacterium]
MLEELGRNYFELFGIPKSFEIDNTQLTGRYHDLQRRFHPDKYANASDQERRLSMQVTAQINEALQTLRDPVRRGRYLLMLAGIEMNDETDTKMDPGFLMEQMELREALAAVDTTSNPLAKLEEIMTEVDGGREVRLQKLSQLFSAGDDKAHSEIRKLLRELQFLQKIYSEIEELEEVFI